MKATSVLCFIACLFAAVTMISADYGSYVVICDETFKNVTFVNFPLYNCQGVPTLFSEPLNTCGSELAVFSWNGFCNATNMWYNNFAAPNCTGTSVLSRMYVTYQCKNCLNVECKNS
ncbi:membrane-associated protein, putative [Bodo saltans]|uniref:Membrane-associated protein, putative n=1 Tax=Bodo saltans TaxID=75058 RepID=A0A0S4JQT4_BODSA|nr:membrane-associated protein, putative [Bodo saltans]|eukprot:CUG92907.1 membrane-associated protein, putative [Bodo saltans]